MITQDKVNQLVLAGKAKAVEMSGMLTEIGNDGSYKFRNAKYDLMYIMSYIQTLENYDISSDLLSEEELIKSVERLDLMCMKAE